MNNVIVTDCDGVLLNWEYAFNVWVQQKGYKLIEDYHSHYNVGSRYGLPYDEGFRLVHAFNESAAIGFLPPLRDAMYYVDRLHKEHGFVFHVITSLSKDASAQRLRMDNLRKLFGDTCIERFVCLDTGADKDEALKEYEGSGYLWIEDKWQNYAVGEKLGLDCRLMLHDYNVALAKSNNANTVRNWKDIYNDLKSY